MNKRDEEMDKCITCNKIANPNTYYGAFCDEHDPKSKLNRTIDDVKLESDTPIEKYKQSLRDGSDYMGITSEWIHKLDTCKLTRFAVGQLVREYLNSKAALLSCQKQLDEANEVIGLYGEPNNWFYPGNDYHDFQIAREDIGPAIRIAKTGREMKTTCGGKRAREYFTKYPKDKK